MVLYCTFGVVISSFGLRNTTNKNQGAYQPSLSEVVHSLRSSYQLMARVVHLCVLDAATCAMFPTLLFRPWAIFSIVGTVLPWFFICLTRLCCRAPLFHQMERR